MKNFKSVAIPFFAALICLFAVARCVSDADLDRSTKAKACIFLVRAALQNNEDYFGEVTSTLKYEETDSDDLVRKWTDKALLNCYNTVSMIKSADLIGRGKPEKISPYAKDNAEILNINNFHRRYDTDASRLVKDAAKFKEILAALQDEVTPLIEATTKFAKDAVAQTRKEQQQEEQKRQKEDKEEFGDHQYGNVNMGFLKRMDPNLKLGIGFGLMLMFVIFFLIALKALRNSDIPVEKKKKNKTK